ncbi:MAG: tetratricopeptide repeat protein [Bacteroidetes bacterium]|nr:tetratricopeptide repeat protein [Bacteroidota bacterium]
MRKRVFFSLAFLCLLCAFKAQDDTINSILAKYDSDSLRINKLFRWAFTLSKNNPEKAIELSQRGIELSKNQKNSLKASCLKSLALAYYYKGDYPTALKINVEALAESEKYKDKDESAIILNHIGMIYDDMSQFAKSIDYYKQSITLMQETKNQHGVASLLNNIGLSYYNMGQSDSALSYFEKAYSENSKIKNREAIAMILTNMAGIYFDENDFETCLKYDTKALEIRKELNDQFQIASSLNNIGYDYVKLKQYEKGISYHQQAMALGRSINAKEIIKSAYDGLTNAYLGLKDYKQAYEFSEKYNLIKDSIFNEKSSAQINELSVRYETEKKESENKLLQKENELSLKTIKQQKIVSAFIIAFLAVALVFSLFVYKAYKEKQKSHQIILNQKKEVELKNHIIEEKQKEILDSINYAKRIQYTLLAHADFLKENIPNHFVYFNPKDIVSGDFYWATKRGNKFYLAVCDSTGHGVPGAFMSLLNISFLNEAVNEKGIEEPNKVFDFVRQRLIDNISKEGQKDGFDGILICLDKSNNKITYVAANNAPVLIKAALRQAQGPAAEYFATPELLELESDRMPVGMGERKENFKLFTVEANTGDTLYLYTDGYADQFGGPKGKKFKYKQLNEVLLVNHNKPLSEQKEILKQTFESWRGNLEQVDDVCVIGIRL